jgi:hypothetical protein
MKTRTAKLFLILSILALILIAGAPSPSGVYTSEWRVLATGAQAEFTHGLGARPLDVHMWASAGPDKVMPAYAEPYTAFPGLTFRVDAQQVIVINAGKPVKVQVTARP